MFRKKKNILKNNTKIKWKFKKARKFKMIKIKVTYQ